jgi:hypothetical protein
VKIFFRKSTGFVSRFIKIRERQYRSPVPYIPPAAESAVA